MEKKDYEELLTLAISTGADFAENLRRKRKNS